MFLPQPVLAACANPTKKTGEIIYNGDHKVLQYCDGTDWIAMGKAAAGIGATAGATLNKPAPAASDNLGIAAAVSGTTAVIGAPYDDPGGVSSAGTAYVFDTASGNLIATLNNPAPAVDDRFGYSVAVSGTTAVVGAYWDDPSGISNVGSAYVFDTTTGNLISTLNNPDPTANDHFGFRVAVDGTTAVVGAGGDDPGGVSAAGTAYVFDTATGSLLATLNNPAPESTDRFGEGVAVSGTTAVVGAYLDAPGGIGDAGTAYVFDTTSGSLIATLNNPAPTSTDTFGETVAVSGTVAVVGATLEDPGGISAAGAAYVFDTASGSLIATLNNPDPTVNDTFGYSVAVSGNIAVVGTNSDDPAGISGAGTAYVFDTETGSLIATLNNPAPATNDGFGGSVAVSGTTMVVGAAGDDPGGVSSAGTAYVFSLGCANPAGGAGTMFYNTDYRVPQYCNGSQWVAMGPLNTSGGAGSCSNPVHAPGTLMFNDDCKVVQYCDGANWQSVGKNLSFAPPVFDFIDLFDQAQSAQILSDIVPISGSCANRSVSIGGGGPEYRICSDATCSAVVQDWTSSAGAIANNQYLQLRVTTSVGPFIINMATVTVDGVSADWNVTTGCHAGGSAVGGYCWYAGANGASCTTACSTHGGYNTATRSYAGDNGTNAHCKAVLDVFPLGSGAVTDVANTVGGTGIGCAFQPGGPARWRVTGIATATGASEAGLRRACACNN